MADLIAEILSEGTLFDGHGLWGNTSTAKWFTTASHAKVALSAPNCPWDRNAVTAVNIVTTEHIVCAGYLSITGCWRDQYSGNIC